MKPEESRTPSSDEEVEATAAAWLAERDEGLCPDDQQVFCAWRAQDPRHEAAVLRLERSWQAMQQLREFRPAAARHPDGDLLGATRSRRLPRRPALAAAAVAAAVAVGLFLARLPWRDDPVARDASPSAPVAYATTVGGYQRMMLPDGSVVNLNASSEIREVFTPEARRIELVRGEATFTVAKNPAWPFVVEANGVAVRAIGTAFNVRMHADKVDVLVTEGRVQVEALKPVGGTVLKLPELEAGQRVTVPLAATEAQPVVVSVPAVQTVSPAIIREELSWQEPRLVFVETPLGEVIRQFNARNRVQLELGDPSLAALPVGGSFRAEHVEAFVRLLVSDGDLSATFVGTEKIVLRRSAHE